MLNGTYGQELPLLPELREQFYKAKRIDIIVSFVMKSGISLLEEYIRSTINSGVPIRILTSTYMNVTDPTALSILRDAVGSKGDIRLYTGSADSFHPKAYIFRGEGTDCVYIGSSNISRTALTDGVEWNYKIEKGLDPIAFKTFSDRFEYLYQHEAIELSDEILRDYRNSYVNAATVNRNINQHFKKYQKNHKTNLYAQPIADLSATAQASEIDFYNQVQPHFLHKPNDAQLEALIELRRTRAEGYKKALVIAATGLGKTFLAAFDTVDFKKVLFIAHREEILNQAYETFAKVRGDKGLGKLFDGQFDYESDVLFASVQTLMRAEHLENFNAEAFDYIVFDEFHHAASKSYRKILDHFKPDFLLGITATPYRMDQQNVFELCDYNVVYEADLFTAINRDWLAPFYYYGIYDATVNYEKVTYLNGKYLESELEAEFNKSARGELILEHFKKWRSKRTLGFCATIKHADYMAQYFSEAGIKAVSVHSGSDSKCWNDRGVAIEGLTSGDIEVIFSVDMFNEGVDIPLVDTLLFLRPTESSTVFLQQLGRGLRKANGKKKVRVLDFIGNYKKASIVPFLLSGRKISGQDGVQLSHSKYPSDASELTKQLGLEGIGGYLDNESNFPVGCVIDFEFGVIDLMDKMLKTKVILNDRIIAEFLALKETLGSVPTRMEFYEAMETDFYKSVKAKAKTNPFLEYIGFLERNGEINSLSEAAKRFINFIETTSMSQLYKIPVLLAFCKKGRFQMSVSSEEIVESFRTFYTDPQNSKDLLRNKEGKDYKTWTDKDYEKKAYDNPVKYLCKTHSELFSLDDESKVVRILLDLKEYEHDTEFIEQVLDAVHMRRSDFLNTRLANT